MMMTTALRALAFGLVFGLLSWLAGAAAWAAPPPPGIPAGLSFQAYIDLGTRHFRAGQYDLAVAALEAALKKEQPARLFFNLARAYHKAGRRPEALATYERYLKAEPSSPRRAEVEAHCDALRGELGVKGKGRLPSPRDAARAGVGDRGLLDPPPEPKPLYKRGWFWGVIAAGVVVVGASITAGVILGRRSTDTTAMPKTAALVFP